MAVKQFVAKIFCVGRFEERPRVRALCERVRTRERSCVRTRAGTRTHARWLRLPLGQGDVA